MSMTHARVRAGSLAVAIGRWRCRQRRRRRPQGQVRGRGAAGTRWRPRRRRGAAAPAPPTPRWPDGKPILGSVPGQPVGGWGAGVTTLPRGMNLDEIPFQPWARAAYDIRQIDQFEPHTRCKASGVSRQFSTPYGTEFVEVPDLQRMYIMDNGGPNSYRIIYLDGRDVPEGHRADQLRLLDRHAGRATRSSSRRAA